jgi:hypothetical protein
MTVDESPLEFIKCCLIHWFPTQSVSTTYLNVIDFQSVVTWLVLNQYCCALYVIKAPILVNDLII